MHVAFSSVNCGLNVKPSLLKNSTVLLRSFTGKLTKICFVILFLQLFSARKYKSSELYFFLNYRLKIEVKTSKKLHFTTFSQLCNAYSSYCEYTVMILDKSHNESKVEKDSGSLICDVCEQTFDTMESFKEHKASENKDEGLKYKGID